MKSLGETKIKWYVGLAFLHQTAHPDKTPYEQSCRAAEMRAGEMCTSISTWNTHYLAELFREGLMLVSHPAVLMIHDECYPGGQPIVAPRPTDDEPDLWPPETWIIYRDQP